jgi:hypothetical protein
MRLGTVQRLVRASEVLRLATIDLPAIPPVLIDQRGAQSRGHECFCAAHAGRAGANDDYAWDHGFCGS